MEESTQRIQSPRKEHAKCNRKSFNIVYFSIRKVLGAHINLIIPIHRYLFIIHCVIFGMELFVE